MAFPGPVSVSIASSVAAGPAARRISFLMRLSMNDNRLSSISSLQGKRYGGMEEWVAHGWEFNRRDEVVSGDNRTSIGGEGGMVCASC